MSKYFKDQKHMYEFLQDLWNHIVFESGVGDKLRQYNVSYCYTITDPDGYAYIDADNVIMGDEAKRDSVLKMEMSADTIILFWLKKLSLPVALATRKIKARGPVPTMIKMTPVLKPIYPVFPDFCKKHNIPID